ncbi:carboxylesterase type B [Streptomyces umbrinus]|uniref:Carboxylesterase type B n=1 Tax=Streptomyces umbrinus TaxID=67370 RepID=A0ABU0T774_9ACTN|nr:carboxylesterase family protein [Streptomyces umbrinus]MDQ1031666.1 carboxylesterase type B [Streptomyces umbrinus]
MAPRCTECDELPVFFRIHDGANTFGSAAQPDDDGAAPARAALVVVGCNCRVGCEGYGHVLGAVPDNRGLLDKAAALSRVQENIAACGGDPTNVTLAGYSSGGSAVVCPLAMERTRGLFRRAVAHSVPQFLHSAGLAAEVTGRIAEEAGVAPTAEGLLSVAREELVAASNKTAARCTDDPVAPIHAYAPAIFQPVVDDEALPADPLTALTSGAAQDVELPVCHATEEQWFLHTVGAVREGAPEAALAEFAQALRLPARLVDGYAGTMPDTPVLDRHLAPFGDAQFGEYTTRLAEQHARATVGPTWPASPAGAVPPGRGTPPTFPSPSATRRAGRGLPHQRHLVSRDPVCITLSCLRRAS